VGQLVGGKYLVESRLGEGAMGVVYRANQVNLDRPVAVKFIQPAFATRRGARLRFQREARVSAALHHPNAVKVNDFGEHDDLLYLVMEFLDGAPLSRMAGGGNRLPLDDVLDVARQIASVLVAAHDMQLVHRDLKPDNIFVESTAEDALHVVVVDFGMAFIAGADATDLGRMTGEGVLGGTPAYMAPEQAMGKPVGPAADVYSLACVLYELVAGVPPFDGTVAQLLTKQAYEEPPSLRERSPERSVSAELDALVTDMLRKSAAHRPSAQRVLERLRHLGETDAERLRRADDPAYVGPRSQRAVRATGAASAATQLLDTNSPAAGPQPTAETVRGDASSPADGAEPNLDVCVRGELDSELVLAMATNGIRLIALADGAPVPGDCGIVFAPGAEPATVAAEAQSHAAVVTDTDIRDSDRIVALIRAGADDVVARPLDPGALARKLRSLARRNERRRPRE